jgi:hypothetical protein
LAEPKRASAAWADISNLLVNFSGCGLQVLHLKTAGAISKYEIDFSIYRWRRSSNPGLKNRGYIL